MVGSRPEILGRWQADNSGAHLPGIVGTGRVAGYGSSSRDADGDAALDAVPGLRACVASDRSRAEAAGVSALWHDAVGGDALAEDDAAEAVAGGDGVALVFALRAPVVRALRRAAGALCEPRVLVALLAPAAGARGRGGGMRRVRDSGHRGVVRTTNGRVARRSRMERDLYLYLPPETYDCLAAWAGELGWSVTDLIHWAIDEATRSR